MSAAESLSIRAWREARATAWLAAPLIGNNLANIAMQTTDTVMAGRLSPLDLAAVALGGAIWMTVILLGLGVMMALSPLVAHAHGAGQRDRVAGYMLQGAWVGVVIAVVSFVLVRSATPLLEFTGTSPELTALTMGYLKALSWCTPAFFLSLALRFTSEGLGVMRPVLTMAVAGMLLNIPANLVMMYGYFGFPALGAEGCGWATAMVQYAMLMSLAISMRSGRAYRAHALQRRPEAPDWRRQWEIYRLGLPIGIAILMEAGMFSATALMMGSLGTEVVAAHQIAINFASVMFMVPLGLSFAITVRVGHALGRGDPAGARFSSYVGIGVAGGFMLCSALLIFLAAPHVAGFYTDDLAVGALASSLLMVAAIFQFSDGIQVAEAGALRGFQDTRVPMLMTVFAYWIVGVPLAWYLGIHRAFGPHTVWMGMIAGLTVAALLLGLRLWRVGHRPPPGDAYRDPIVEEGSDPLPEP